MNVFFSEPATALSEEHIKSILEDNVIHPELYVVIKTVYNIKVPVEMVAASGSFRYSYYLSDEKKEMFSKLTINEIAKLYHEKKEYEKDHMINLGYLLNKLEIDLVLQYIPKDNIFYKYRIAYRWNFFLRYILCRDNPLFVIEEYSNVLRNDIFLQALCSKFQYDVEQKIKEIIIMGLCWIRSCFIKVNYDIQYILTLNQIILGYYDFEHSDTKDHIVINNIISIISGNYNEYIQGQYKKLSNRNLGFPNIQDLLGYLVNLGSYGEIWKILWENMDLVIKLRKNYQGCVVLALIFVKYNTMFANGKKDNLYYFMLQLKKLCVNRIIDFRIGAENSKNVIFFGKLFDGIIHSECINCLQSFKIFRDIIYECCVCKCTYHMHCLQEMVNFQISRCAVCRKESYGKVLNFPEEIGLLCK